MFDFSFLEKKLMSILLSNNKKLTAMQKNIIYETL